MVKARLLVILTVLISMIGFHVSPATAAAPVAASDGTRLVVTFTGKQPATASISVNGTRFRLKRAGKVWRTQRLGADILAAAAGKSARVKAKIGKRNRTYTTTVAGGGSTTPTTPNTPPTTPSVPPLFTAPGVDSTGKPAWEAIKGYFANSTLTDCPAGWPNCAVEQRYGYFQDGTTWYCRLTSNSGSDIRSQATIQQIVGAEQKADGSWAVSYQDLGYGYTHYYTVRVSATGAGQVLYWATGVDPNSGPPSEVYNGLQWMRGAKDCSY